MVSEHLGSLDPAAEASLAAENGRESRCSLHWKPLHRDLDITPNRSGFHEQQLTRPYTPHGEKVVLGSSVARKYSTGQSNGTFSFTSRASFF